MMFRHPRSHVRSLSTGAALLLLSTALGCSSSAPAIPQGAPSAGPDTCVGVNPSLAPKPLLPQAVQPAGCPRPGICAGQPAANWQAYDFQDRSCGYGQKYGMKDFTGKVTVLVHLAGWCAYCQNQTIKLERLRLDLAQQGDDINFVIVNAKNADNDNDRKALVENCSFAVFQDHADFGIWELNGGGKDDMYIYDPSGRLLEYIPHNTLTTDLSSEANYAGLKERLATLARRFATPQPGADSSTTGTSSTSTGTGLPSGVSSTNTDNTATSTGI